MADSTCCASDTSRIRLGYFPLSESSVSVARAALISRITTCAPSLAKSCAVAAPIPLPPPVMTTTFPSSCLSISRRLSARGHGSHRSNRQSVFCWLHCRCKKLLVSTSGGLPNTVSFSAMRHLSASSPRLRQSLNRAPLGLPDSGRRTSASPAGVQLSITISARSVSFLPLLCSAAEALQCSTETTAYDAGSDAWLPSPHLQPLR